MSNMSAAEGQLQRELTYKQKQLNNSHDRIRELEDAVRELQTEITDVKNRMVTLVNEESIQHSHTIRIKNKMIGELRSLVKRNDYWLNHSAPPSHLYENHWKEDVTKLRADNKRALEGES